MGLFMTGGVNSSNTLPLLQCKHDHLFYLYTHVAALVLMYTYSYAKIHLHSLFTTQF